MSDFLICLTEEEINHAYLAVNKATIRNGNEDAVKVFESVLEKLRPYAGEATKMAADLMRITNTY